MTSVLIAYSDTGGGHRSAAIALEEALRLERPDVATTLIDPFAACPRWPFRSLSSMYPHLIDSAAWLWHAGFTLTNTPHRTALCQKLAWPALRATFRAIAAAQTPDVVVSTHPLLTESLRRAFPTIPIVVVVTDLISGHASWYNRRVEFTVVPTLKARERAIAARLDGTRVATLGLPVSKRFVVGSSEKSALRKPLGWRQDRPTVLLAGGAEGMGALETLADAIDRAQLPCDLAVIAGRNTQLAMRLRKREWQNTVHVYDFVHNLPEMMRAGAAVVTKAGPGTISESCASGCPMVLYGAIPGQETGNVAFVTDGGAGVWAPSPLAVTNALRNWLVGDDASAALRRASTAARQLARPDAARDIALRVLMTVRSPRPRVDANAASSKPRPSVVLRSAVA